MRTLPCLALLAACAAPDRSAAFNTFELVVLDGAAGPNAELAALADGAVRDLAVALPTLDDADLAEALVAAHDRGVDVRVVTDVDRADADGAVRLAEAGVPLQLADDAVTYFDFARNQDVGWSSAQVRMTSAFGVADRDRLVVATSAGDLAGGPRVVLHGQSEELAEDLLGEHTQLFSGTDATARTAFDSLAKSIADARWAYWSEDSEVVEVWLGPQERPIKRLIDAVYASRASIRLLADDVADEGLARALQQKAEDGFDVEVVVGASFGSTSSALSDVLRNRAPDVALLRATTGGPLPTLLFTDFDPGRDGRWHNPKVHAFSHPVASAARIYGGVEVVNDQLLDSTLLVVHAPGAPTPVLQSLADVYAEARATAEALR